MRAYEVLRAPIQTRYLRSRVETALLPHPFDEPSSRSGRVGADRMLLLGNGPCHGWGVSSHQLAMTGQLSRVLGRQTERGLDVDFVGDDTMNMSSARQWLGDRADGDYDVILVEIGMNDAIRLTRQEQWQQNLAGLLEVLGAALLPASQLIVAGIPPLRSFVQHDNVWGSIGQRHADRLNTATRRLVEATPGARYIDWPRPNFEIGRPHGSAASYEQSATMLAKQLVPVLNEVASGRDGARSHVDAAPVWDWEPTPRAVQLARTGGLPGLQHLMDVAKERFGVDVASVNLIDGDRNWFTANSGGVPVSIPRELAYCNVAIQQDEPLIVPNAQLDARFRDNPFLELTHLPFYAGQMVRSSSGQPIGALCLLGSEPRAASSIELRELQELALLVQQELQQLELSPTPINDADPVQTADTSVRFTPAETA